MRRWCKPLQSRRQLEGCGETSFSSLLILNHWYKLTQARRSRFALAAGTFRTAQRAGEFLKFLALADDHAGSGGGGRLDRAFSVAGLPGRLAGGRLGGRLAVQVGDDGRVLALLAAFRERFPLLRLVRGHVPIPAVQ